MAMKKREVALIALVVAATIVFFYYNFLLDEKYVSAAQKLFAKLFGG